MRDLRGYRSVWGVLSVAALLAAAQQVGCSPVMEEEDVGVVQVAITAVPGDVRCIRLTAVSASRTATRLFDVTPGASSVLLMSGVPTGAVQFSGEAFSDACGAVTPSSVAGWSSDTVSVQVSAGVVANVTLAMRRNGRVNVSVDFQDDAPACTPLGGPCPVGGVSCCPGSACDILIGLCTPPRPPSCTDGVRNGNETDVDCGGPACPGCRVGRACQVSTDCADNGGCAGGVCVPAACLPRGFRCAGVPQPCCSGFVCDPTGLCSPPQAPSCVDGVRNGNETDVDCGGPACPGCRVGRACQVSTDCADNGGCAGGVCVPPVCRPPGAACSVPTDCCSLACVVPGPTQHCL